LRLDASLNEDSVRDPPRDAGAPYQVIVGSGGSPFLNTWNRYYAWALVQVHQSGARGRKRGTRHRERLAGQATHQQDGWTGLSGLSFTAATIGTYWAALEVGSNDSAIGLALPSPTSGGTAPALDFAYSSTGSGGYSDQGASPCGVQVAVADAVPVPLPPAVWLFGSGMLGFGARSSKAIGISALLFYRAGPSCPFKPSRITRF
jgi:hypothetical protein